MNTRNLENVNTLVLYWSKTGNTEKAARAIVNGFEQEGLKPTLKTFEQITDLMELYDYDLICAGAPTWNMTPPNSVMKIVNKILQEYYSMERSGQHKMGSPLLPGKYAAVFCTCAGPHTGLDEALPAVEFLRSFLEHLGYDVQAKWFVPGELHVAKESPFNLSARMGDMRNRPNAQDLAKIETEASELIRKLYYVAGMHEKSLQNPFRKSD